MCLKIIHPFNIDQKVCHTVYQCSFSLYQSSVPVIHTITAVPFPKYSAKFSFRMIFSCLVNLVPNVSMVILVLRKARNLKKENPELYGVGGKGG